MSALPAPNEKETNMVSPSPSTNNHAGGLNDDSPTISETSSAVVVATYTRPVLSQSRKTFMLLLFCLAEFMDSFIGSALFPGITVIEGVLKVGVADISWAFAAYACTFSAFLLISGRFSDVYSASEYLVIG